MLNYVWMALIVLGMIAAVAIDVTDVSTNTYMNGEELTVQVDFPEPINEEVDTTYAVMVTVPEKTFESFYGVEIENDLTFSARVARKKDQEELALYFTLDENAPKIWQTMASASGNADDLTGKIMLKKQDSPKTFKAVIVLEEIAFLKLKDVTNAALDFAEVAVNIALGLIGIMALWLGIMKIAEEAGIVNYIAKALRPLTKFLFPDVPTDHAAVTPMIMNISANFLGLGNAATPFGLKAMEELDKLNENKGTATNAMCMFLAINTAGLALIPATAIAIRAAAGSAQPAIIIGTSLFASSCATLAGITAAKIFEGVSDFPSWLQRNIKIISWFVGIIVVLALLLITGVLGMVGSALSFLNVDLLKNIIQIISIVAIPAIITSFVILGLVKKVKVYETFVEGAKEGFNIAVKIIPYLVAMLVAIGIFRESGAMAYLKMALEPLTSLIGMPAEALPMAIMRPLSGSGSTGIMAEIIATHGPDSFLGILVSTFFGSTETTFYVLAVYFGSVGVKNIRHALPVGLIADVAGILAAVFIVTLLFG